MSSYQASYSYAVGDLVAFLDKKGTRHQGTVQRVKIIISEPTPALDSTVSVYYDIHAESCIPFSRETQYWSDVPEGRVLHKVKPQPKGGAGSSWEERQRRTNEKYSSIFGDDEDAEPFFKFDGTEADAQSFREFFERMTEQFRRAETGAKGGGKKTTTDASEEARRRAEEANRRKDFSDFFRSFGSEDHWATLGIPKGSSKEEIKRAWRKKVMEWHPDRNQHRAAEAEEMIKKINKAYEVLY